MHLLKIDHIAINIKNLQKTFDWYHKLFGFGIIHKWTHTWMIGNESIKIGVFERPEASVISDIDKNIIAIQHFAFLTDKVGFENAVAEIDKMGIPHEPVEDTGIALSIFLTDPDGHQVEITTYHS
jgi:catechol 2,3-dioxygenase-like lactoylglutathione lyase family enzyme